MSPSMPMDIAKRSLKMVVDKAIDEIQWGNLVRKSIRTYAHFDAKTDLRNPRTADYVKAPDKVKKHGFYPFIHYRLEYHRYSSSGEKNSKIRDVCYAAHIDRCIYQYYSYLLNEAYLERIKADSIFDVPIAYRTDLHKNNIHFAKRAFDFIRVNAPCSILIGDFKSFFDKLDHGYLKKQWCSLLGVDNLPDDHYAVYKSITKYSMCERKDLLRLNGLKDTPAGVKELNKKKRVFSVDEYHSFRKAISYDQNNTPQKFIVLNQHTDKQGHMCGIPQGSPISASLANIYMLEIDKYISERVGLLGGLYMRYCDDFIIVIPGQDNIGFNNTILESFVDYLNKQPGVILEPQKTQYFYYCDSKITGYHAMAEHNLSKSILSFLGFSYDGSSVVLRSKTIFKYFTRMYKKARTITKRNGVSPRGNKISCKRLYRLYSFRGTIDGIHSDINESLGEHRKCGNFISYVMRAKEIMGSNFNEKILPRHMSKIRKALKK